MSRTKRFYNYPNKVLSEWTLGQGWKPLWHPYKRVWSNKNGLDEEYLMSKRRREKYKIEIKREVLNLQHFELYDNDGFHSNCFRNCESWRRCCFPDGSCSYAKEIKVISFRECTLIK